MKSGFVSIIGKPNVGKSTLINKILNKKISIVTSKAQTTRNAIEGIYNDDDTQIIFVDTPGIHRPFNELGKSLDKTSYATIRNCDVCLLVVDSSHKLDESDNFIFEHLKIDSKLIVAFNKIDLTNINLISIIKEKYKEVFPSASFVEISALDGFGIDDLIKKVKILLSEGPQYYDVKTVTTRDLTFQIQEIIREQILKLLKEEVPHGVAVICDEVDENNLSEIYGKIIVEKDSQKGIVIGAKGSMIKKIGTRSRKNIEELLGRHINLELRVQVVENWRNSESFLAKTGFKI